MTVRDDMLNGHAICHGGFIFLLADSTFAFACNSYNRNTVAQGCSIDFLAPAHAGDVLHAIARRAQPHRPHRRLRHRSAQPARQDRRAVSRQELPHRRPRRRRSLQRPATRGEGSAHARQISRDPATSSRSRRASRDELAALQLERLRWSLRHAYDNVAALPAGVRRAPACIPTICARSTTSRAFPFTDQERPARQLSVRHVRRAARAGRRASTRRRARPASRRSSATRATTSTPGRR